jgi:hypothetical protein
VEESMKPNPCTNGFVWPFQDFVLRIMKHPIVALFLTSSVPGIAATLWPLPFQATNGTDNVAVVSHLYRILPLKE